MIAFLFIFLLIILKYKEEILKKVVYIGIGRSILASAWGCAFLALTYVMCIVIKNTFLEGEVRRGFVFVFLALFLINGGWRLLARITAPNREEHDNYICLEESKDEKND